jgi:hypothetical protein
MCCSAVPIVSAGAMSMVDGKMASRCRLQRYTPSATQAI